MRNWFLAFLALVGGCSGYSGSVAEDVVCRAMGDLGCVRVRVLEGTPRATFDGTTYYFCRDSCRDRFLEDPGRYVEK